MVFTDPRRARNERTPSPQTELLNSAKSVSKISEHQGISQKCCICDYTSGQTWDECAHPENQLTGYAARLRRSGGRGGRGACVTLCACGVWCGVQRVRTRAHCASCPISLGGEWRTGGGGRLNLSVAHRCGGLYSGLELASAE